MTRTFEKFPDQWVKSAIFGIGGNTGIKDPVVPQPTPLAEIPIPGAAAKGITDSAENRALYHAHSTSKNIGAIPGAAEGTAAAKGVTGLGTHALKNPLGTWQGIKGVGEAAVHGGSQLLNKVFGSVPFNALMAYGSFGGRGERIADSYGHLNKKASEEKQVATLKDVLVQKIAAAKNPKTTTKIAAKDIQYLDSLIGGLTKKADVVGRGMQMLSEGADAGMHLLQSGANGAGDLLKGFGGGIPKFMGGIGTNLMPLLATGSMLGAGAMGVDYIAGKANNVLKRHNAYNDMFQEFPQLNDVPRTQVDKYWQVLADFAPALTTNPLVAGQFIQNMINYGVQGIDHNTAGQLITMQNQSAVKDSGPEKMMGSLAQTSMGMTASPQQMHILHNNYGDILGQLGIGGETQNIMDLLGRGHGNAPMVP